MSDDYLLQGDDEGRRLMRQAQYLRPVTERALRAAGIGPGTRVLDLGCGMGDVALISAELGAEVVSIERDPTVAAAARARLGDRAQVVVGDIADPSVSGSFDAITGRLILMYVRDPAAVIRALAHRFLRPGGAVAFVEYDFASLRLGGPELFHSTLETCVRIIKAAGFHADLGLRWPEVFEAAGLRPPAIEAHLWTSTHDDDLGPEMCTNVLRNSLPLGAQLGIVKASDFDLATLPARIRSEMRGRVGIGPLVVSAVSRVA